MAKMNNKQNKTVEMYAFAYNKNPRSKILTIPKLTTEQYGERKNSPEPEMKEDRKA